MADDDVRITLVLPRELLADFDVVAQASYRSRAAELRRLIEERVKQHKGELKPNAGGA